MSRLYEMSLDITDLDPARMDQVQDAIEEAWPFEGNTTTNTEKVCLHTCGQGNLSGGMSEETFAHLLAKTIFEANGGPCTIELDATYMENLPYTKFTYGPHQYKELKEKGEMDTEEGDYISA